MITVSRDAVYLALFALLKTVKAGNVPVATASRFLKHWDDVPPAQQPALFLCAGKSHNEQPLGLPPKWTLEAKLYLYTTQTVQDPAVDLLPQTNLNNWLDAIETALQPTGPLPLNLGGLVVRCSLKDVETDEGTLGQQAVAIATVEILAL